MNICCNARRRTFALLAAGILFLIATGAGVAAGASKQPFYVRTKLVSSGGMGAKFKDKMLINPWGLAYLPGGNPIWIADNNAGVSTLYNPNGKKVALTVTIPLPMGATGTSTPDGLVANNSSSFGGNHFIFDTEDGTISAWGNGTAATLMVDNSGKNAVYKGLAMGKNGPDTLLYATDFRLGTVEVYDTNFAPVNLGAGAFTDDQLPAGYAPFGIVNLNNSDTLYVTYALQSADKHDSVAGAGNGFVDVFKTDGTLTTRLIKQGALNAPWGVAMAPADFGPLSNMLLVGNFGDGKINGFDPGSGAFADTVTNSKGKPIAIDGLWSLVFGDSQTGSPETLFFTAGPKKETKGLFGTITLHKPKASAGGGGGGGWMNGTM